MIIRCTIDDLEYVNFVMRHPAIYPFITDDGCPRVADFDAKRVLMLDNIYFLKPILDNYCIGIFILSPCNTICYDAHLAIFPEYRGEMAIRACKEVIHYMFTETSCRKIIAQIPSINKPARMIAKLAGLAREGVIKTSFLKNGILVDQVIMGITKEGEKCHPQL